MQCPLTSSVLASFSYTRTRTQTKFPFEFLIVFSLPPQSSYRCGPTSPYRQSSNSLHVGEDMTQKVYRLVHIRTHSHMVRQQMNTLIWRLLTRALMFNCFSHVRYHTKFLHIADNTIIVEYKHIYSIKHITSYHIVQAS
jgi:hypothetical protein